MSILRYIFTRLLSHAAAKNGFIVLSGSVITNVLAYLYHLIVGRILGPVYYGEFAALLSLFYIINVPSLVIQTVLTKQFSILKARKEDEQAKQLFISSIKWIGAVSSLGFLFLYPIVPYLTVQIKISSASYFYWMYGIFISFFLTIVPVSVLQAYQMFFQYNIFVILGALLRLFFGALLSLFGVGWVLIGNIFSNLVSFISFFIPLRFLLYYKNKPVTLPIKNVLIYSIPSLFSIVSITAIFSQDVLLVKRFFSSYDAGIYSALSILGKVIFYASSAISVVVFPMIAERTELMQRHKRLVWFSLATVLGISLLITGIYALIPKLVVWLLLGNAFMDAAAHLGLFGLFLTFYSAANLLIISLLAQGNTRVWLMPMVAALLQVILISIYHANLQTVVWINIIITVTLFLSLLLYYRYASDTT